MDGSLSLDHLQLLLDERAITRVLHRYCHAVDRLDADELRSVYHADARAEHGTYSEDIDGFVADTMERLVVDFATTTHSLSNVTIDIRGCVAFTESYVMASHVLSPARGGGLVWFSGRYIDRFECRDGDWRIVLRSVFRTWDRVDVPPNALEGDMSLPNGVRSSEDPSYRRD
jgi:hypothetical protein